MTPRDPAWLRALLISLTFVFFALLIFLPLALVFVEAFKKGWEAYLAAWTEDAALKAIELTLLTTAVVVPLNAVFGVAAAWAITKFQFRGKTFLVSLSSPKRSCHETGTW